jgi:hypothetical protein
MITPTAIEHAHDTTAQCIVQPFESTGNPLCYKTVGDMSFAGIARVSVSFWLPPPPPSSAFHPSSGPLSLGPRLIVRTGERGGGFINACARNFGLGCRGASGKTEDSV